MECRLSAAGERVIFEVVDHERTGVKHLDRFDHQRGSRISATGKHIGLLEKSGPKPLAAHPWIKVGSELEGLGPAVPRAGGLVRRAGKT